MVRVSVKQKSNDKQAKIKAEGCQGALKKTKKNKRIKQYLPIAYHIAFGAKKRQIPDRTANKSPTRFQHVPGLCPNGEDKEGVYE